MPTRLEINRQLQELVREAIKENWRGRQKLADNHLRLEFLRDHLKGKEEELDKDDPS